MKTTTLLLLLGLAVLAGCGSSPPTRFYALDAIAPVHSERPQLDAPLKLDAVHIPPALDRSAVVRGESHNELHISSQDRWAGDFGEMARRVLTQDLQSRLPANTVIAPESPAPQSARGVVVDILAFQPQESELVLEADWTLLQGAPASPTMQHSVRLTAPAGSSAAAQAAGMSELLGKLADDIVEKLGSPRLAKP